MTPDLQRLRDSLKDLNAIVDELRLELVDDPAWAEPSDTSYLNDSDRANPDIMANVAAMAATNELIAWFGRDDEGYVGLWRGPSQAPLARAPVVRLDTEGQYALVAATVPDYVAMGIFRDGFERRRAALIEAGFSVASSPDMISAALEPFDHPNAYRHKLYNEGRKRRGLEPV
jgi:hypothetical protein